MERLLAQEPLSLRGSEVAAMASPTLLVQAMSRFPEPLCVYPVQGEAQVQLAPEHLQSSPSPPHRPSATEPWFYPLKRLGLFCGF